MKYCINCGKYTGGDAYCLECILKLDLEYDLG